MGRATALCALLAALVAAGTARADALPAPPCVAAGLVAILQPGAPAPVTVGPAVSASDTEGASLPTFDDTQYGVDLTTPEAGAAGCVAGGPGGTHAQAAAWSVLAGAVSGRSIRADLVPAPGDGSGWHLRTTIAGLEVGGAPVEAIAGATVAVGNWGTLTIRAQRTAAALRPVRYWSAALALQLQRSHAGLPAGTLVLIGYAAANRAPAPLPATTPSATTTTTGTTTTTTTTTAATTPTAPPTTTAKPPVTTTTREKHPAAHRPRPAKHTKRPRVRHVAPKPGRAPLTATPPLGSVRYVFPLAAQASWGDSYGTARSDVPGGWHHGDDLFAPLGTPVVAVADGTIFAVGWNAVGGWRLWLADRAGNDFYYAHLSGYTRLARNDHEVKQGDVLGFVGNTGDAFTTPPHLHFEVHPTALLYLGYDGAVDPTTYLRAWRLAAHVKLLPPVELPGGAPSGFGSATDFRRLLAVRPIPAKPKASAQPRGATASPAAQPDAPMRAAPAHLAAGGSRTHGGDGSLAIVVGILLGAAALAAVAHSARDGRNT